MVIAGMAGAFLLEKPSGAWAKIGVAIGGLVLAGFVIQSPATFSGTCTHCPRSVAKQRGCIR